MHDDELTDIEVETLIDKAINIEYPGRVRGCGWDVTKRSLASIPESFELSKLRRHYNRLEKDVQELKTRGYQPTIPSSSSSHMDNFPVNDSGDSSDDHDCPDEGLPEDKDDKLVEVNIYFSWMMYFCF